MLKLAVGSALLATVTQGWALSLGGVQGGVIIGRPLDILVQSSVDASEAAAGLCLEADILYGETRIPASAITVAIHRLGADGSGALRIRVTDPVTEPLVTLVVKAGCGQSFRRSYTLLADPDMPVGPAPSRTLAGTGPARAVVASPVTPPSRPPVTVMPSAAAPAAPVRPAARPASASGTVVAAEESVEQSPIRLAAPAPRPAGVSLKSKARPASALPKAESVASGPSGNPPAAPAPNPTPEASGSRLKLDPVDVSPTPGPATPVSPTSGDAAAPSPDAATGAPDGAISGADAGSAGDVGRELEQLKAEQERLRLAMETMNAQLAQAQADRYSNPVVYGLGAAVVALLGGLWVLLRRRRTSEPEALPGAANPWWETSLPPEAGPSDLPDTEAPRTQVPDGGGPASRVAPVASAAGDVEGLEVQEARESMFREVPVSPLDMDALTGLWQRVDFFESLGQYGDAIELLKQFTANVPRASEAPYLRLLAMASAHGSEDDRRTAQALYEHHFQRLVPAATSRGRLDDDAVALNALSQAWRSPEARAWIEAALSSQPGDLSAPLVVRTADAFDDLLTLWGVLDVLDTLPPEGRPGPQTEGTPPPPGPGAGVVSASAAAPAVVAPDLSLDFQAWTSVNDLPAATPDAAPDTTEAPAGATLPDLPLVPDWEAPAPSTSAAPSPATGSGAAPSPDPAGDGDRPPLDFDFFSWEPPTKDDEDETKGKS